MLDAREIGHDTRFAIGGLRVDPLANTLTNGSRSVHVEPKAMDVLRALASQHGEVASRDWLIEEVWGLEYGGDESLSRAMSVLRRALREVGAPKKLVQTVPKRGYRLTLPAEAEHPRTVPDRPEAQAPRLPAERPSFSLLGFKLSFASLAIFVGIAVLAGALFFTAGSAREPSIAVMPFISVSGDEDDVAFATGLSEEITNRLASNPKMKVTARRSAFSFRERDEDVRTIGRLLGVAHILEGSVRRQGNRIRITAQLVDAKDGYHLWSETFDREVSVGNVLLIQEEVSRAVLQQMQLETGTASPQRAQMTDSAEAYQAYLRGKGLYREAKSDSLETAIVELNRAVTLDPDFAEAHAALASAYILSYGLGARDFEITDPLMRQHLARALDLAPDSPEVLKARALIWISPDQETLSEYLEEALAANPNDPVLLREKATLMAETDRFTEAEALFEQAVELDPLHALPYIQLARIKSELDQPEEGIAALKRALELDPDLHIAAFRLGLEYIHRGEIRRGHALIRSVEGELSHARNFLADYYVQIGLPGLAAERANDTNWHTQALMALQSGGTRRALMLADLAPEAEYAARVDIYAKAGERDKAYRIAVQSLDHYPWLLSDDVRPWARNMRGIANGYIPLFREKGDERAQAIFETAARWFSDRRPPDTFYVNIVRMELARWHALNGNHDQVLEWLQRVNATHLPWSTLELDPLFDDFKITPQYRRWAAQRDALAKENRDAIAGDLANPLTDWAAIGRRNLKQVDMQRQSGKMLGALD